MKPSRALVLLAIPLFVIGLMMSPLLSSLMAGPIDFALLLPVLVSFGVPQYIVFAALMAVIARRRTESQIKRLALWAPLLFVPFLVAPIAIAQSRVRDAIETGALMAGMGLVIGYLCVGIAFLGWGDRTNTGSKPDELTEIEIR